MGPSTPDSYRDVEPPDPPDRPTEPRGRNVVAVVGIDRYAAWPTLHNAVSDARGATGLFTRLGFELAAEPLLDEAATEEALSRLVTDDLARLGPEDSLVLFFAGHGYTRTHHLSNAVVKTGYLIPADGEGPTGSAASWVRLDSWLSDVARLRARHILVILDACYSGVALDAVVTWRGGDGGTPSAEPLAQLRARQSRRVITSALEDQRALDSGPVPGHSLFTGCLIEALTGGLARDGKREATGSELGQYVQRRVTTFPGSRQTPDFGALELDDRGEIVLPLVLDPDRPAPEPATTTTTTTTTRPPGRRRLSILAYAAGVVVLALFLGIAAPRGCGQDATPSGGALPDTGHGSSDADAPIADAPTPAPPDAPTPAPPDAPTPAPPGLPPPAPPDAPTPAPDRPRSRPLPKPKCWVRRDAVHAPPQPCVGPWCFASCINSTSDDAPVRVPPEAFASCSEVWICEQSPSSP